MLDLATDVDSTQVEVVDPLVNEQDDLLAGAWLAIGIKREPGQVATVLPHQHNRLSLRPLLAGKTNACPRNPLEQISRASGIDVPGDLLHERSFLVLLEGHLKSIEKTGSLGEEIPCSPPNGVTKQRSSLTTASQSNKGFSAFHSLPQQFVLPSPRCAIRGFFVEVLILACTFITVVAGLSATLQNYRIHETVRPAPSWLRPLLLVLCGVVIGMSLVGLLVAANPQVSSASPTTAGEPTVHLGADNFEQPVVYLSKGSKLLLVNDTAVEHLLENGSWTASGTAVTSAEPGAPVLHDLASKGDSTVEIGPFNTAGTFHIYCAIHPGMNLTIIV